MIENKPTTQIKPVHYPLIGKISRQGTKEEVGLAWNFQSKTQAVIFSHNFYLERRK
jgi:hypothetical protein